MKNSLFTITLAGCVLTVPAALHAQNIIHTGGGADITFFYDNVNFDTVFRTKGNTVATGLTSQADQSRPSASPNDYNFDTLTIRLSTPPFVEAGSTSYFVSPASGQSYSTAAEPDLGVRTRFGTTFTAGGFDLTLDPGNSIMPLGAEVALFQFDDVGAPIFQLETATGNFTSTWDPQGHTHWHWGFSQAGNYTLAFTMQGTLADTGLQTGVGSAMVNFEVIPEPSTVALISGLAVLGGVLFLRRRRQA